MSINKIYFIVYYDKTCFIDEHYDKTYLMDVHYDKIYFFYVKTTNQQMSIDKIYFIIYYDKTCFIDVHYDKTYLMDVHYDKTYFINVKFSPITGREWPRGFQEVQVPRFRDNGTGWWYGSQPYAPAAFIPRKCSWYSFLLEAESTSGP
jgi:hypothetical protein